jgi:hypothetical protein
MTSRYPSHAFWACALPLLVAARHASLEARMVEAFRALR